VRGLSQGGRFAAKVGFTLSGVGTPVDGCDVQASIGRTWPDRLHDRAAVEIPLTAKGRGYFADRAAARDLALFVRSGRMQDLRREPIQQAKESIARVYGKQLAHSPDHDHGGRCHDTSFLGAQPHRQGLRSLCPERPDHDAEPEALRVRVLGIAHKSSKGFRRRRPLKRVMAARVSEIEAVYRKRYSAFRATAATITGSAETARDVVQDAFAEALRKRTMFPGGRPAGGMDLADCVAARVLAAALRLAFSRRRDTRSLPLAEIGESALPNPRRTRSLPRRFGSFRRGGGS
jgi:hypothetical protein